MVRPSKFPEPQRTSYRIHLSWDWVKQEIVEIQITDNKTGERQEIISNRSGRYSDGRSGILSV